VIAQLAHQAVPLLPEHQLPETTAMLDDVRRHLTDGQQEVRGTVVRQLLRKAGQHGAPHPAQVSQLHLRSDQHLALGAGLVR
jgi:hypothetical protein